MKEKSTKLDSEISEKRAALREQIQHWEVFEVSMYLAFGSTYPKRRMKKRIPFLRRSNFGFLQH